MRWQMADGSSALLTGRLVKPFICAPAVLDAVAVLPKPRTHILLDILFLRWPVIVLFLTSVFFVIFFSASTVLHEKHLQMYIKSL